MGKGLLAGAAKLCWGSGKLALRLFGHRLGCPVVHICNLNFSPRLSWASLSQLQNSLFPHSSVTFYIVDLRCGPRPTITGRSLQSLPQ